MVSTLQRGFGAGWRVAIAPLLTDAPVVATGVLVAAALPGDALNGLAIAGGLLVGLLGVWTVATARRAVAEPGAPGSADLGRGMLVNIASPHPWIFWLTAGGPLVVGGWREAPWRAVAFLAGFYMLLVGAKVALAAVVARTRHRLPERWRVRLVVVGGVLLVVAGGALVVEGAAGRVG